MNKLILFFMLFSFYSHSYFSQARAVDYSQKEDEKKIKKEFNMVFTKKKSLIDIKEENYIIKIINKGLDIQLQIIDLLASKFTVQNMEKILDDIRKSSKIEKIANYLFEQISYTMDKVKNELRNNK